MDLDAGSLHLRLVRRGQEPCSGLRLRLHAGDVEAVAERLTAAGLRLLSPPTVSPQGTLEARLEDGDGHQLELWCRLPEDEWGFVPELPTTRPWAPSAEAKLQRLLARVPDTFRYLARRGTVAEAEALAAPGQEVPEEAVVPAFIRATPRLMRGHLLEPLRQEGHVPEDFRADFEC